MFKYNTIKQEVKNLINVKPARSCVFGLRKIMYPCLCIEKTHIFIMKYLVIFWFRSRNNRAQNGTIGHKKFVINYQYII